MRVYLPCREEVMTLAASDILAIVQVQMKICASKKL